MLWFQGETYNFKNALILSQYKVDSNLTLKGKVEKVKIDCCLIKRMALSVFVMDQLDLSRTSDLKIQNYP